MLFFRLPSVSERREGEAHVEVEAEFPAHALLVADDRVRQIQADRHVDARHHDAETIANADVRLGDWSEMGAGGVADVAEDRAAQVIFVDRVGQLRGEEVHELAAVVVVVVVALAAAPVL